ncbi:MAG: hypothetical protein J6T57_04595 [Alphaproteobacteria bacterium]|nr:hypothetical protein [Alphaproteobacteria bacterium]
MPIRISIDLDNTVFNVAEKYRDIVLHYDGTYTAPICYDVYKNGYSRAAADALLRMFNSDAVYQTRVFDERIPNILNLLYKNPQYELFYITERGPEKHIPTLGQLHRAGIICEDSHLVHRIPKVDALREYNIALCFDDAPHVVSDCIENNIGVVMISNEHMAYNHHLRTRVENYPDLMTAIMQRGLVK